MRIHALLRLAFGLSLLTLGSPAQAQDAKAPTDEEIIAKVSTVAPAHVVKDATIVVMEKDGTRRVVREGTGEFTCIQMAWRPGMCLDRNAQAWVQALQSHQTPPVKIGIVYELEGGNPAGGSNTDPYAKGPQPDNHWIRTGPSVAIVGISTMTDGHPRDPDAAPTKPWVMYPGTPYEHLMIPVK